MNRTQLMRMPIGIDDFKKLVQEGCFFVDKSRFIVDVLNSRSEVTLITRPRRFGKTLNLSMLRYFLDEYGAQENKNLFDNLAINEYPEAIAEMGKHPVLMLSLKGMKASSFKEQLDAFRVLMNDLYHDHIYLYDHLDSIDQAFFDQVRGESTNDSQLTASLKRLIRYIERYHKKKVVVLIDEYDHPLLNAFHRGFEKEFRGFYRSFMGSAFKGNVSLKFAVITGIMQMAGSGMFSDFNNVDMHTILDERYSSAFGFNEDEVQSLLLSIEKKDKLDEVKRWYNGYLFGKQHVMYNPWSVLMYVSKDCEPDAYWAYTSDNQLLQKELYGVEDVTRAKFLELMADQGKIAVTLPKRLRFSEVGTGKETSLWVLLLSSGYLQAHIGLDSHGALIGADLSIPNEEVRFIYRHLFHSWLTQRLGITDDSASLLAQLRQGDVEGFCRDFKARFQSSVSMHDVKSNTVEAFYHGYVLGLLSMISQTHMDHIRSNAESGLGRYDITLEPKDPEKSPGIVFEFKRIDAEALKGKTEAQIDQALKVSAQKGLKQIKARAYDAELVARGVKSVAYISMAFAGKQMNFVCQGVDALAQ